MYRVDVAVVGAGFSGTVCAERLAAKGATVLVIDQRAHVGGNAYDYIDQHGVLVHKYGPHIFHTNSDDVVAYLSNFTAWRPYEHRVRAYIDGILYPFPINRTTLNMLYGLNLTTDLDVDAYFKSVRQERSHVLTSEDIVVSRIGQDLCDKFFRGYTRKQWGRDLSELSAQVAGRIPVRTNDDDRYFQDKHQIMPARGYTAMFENMLDRNRIQVVLGRSWSEMRSEVNCKHLVFTGPIDEYYECQFGKLPYRSLIFEMVHCEKDCVLPVATVNYPNDYDFTRVTEFKHITGQQVPGTTLCKEYPTGSGDPYYPIPARDTQALYVMYDLLSRRDAAHVTFVGRLAQYRYYNMDQAVAGALSAAKEVGRKIGAV